MSYLAFGIASFVLGLVIATIFIRAQRKPKTELPHIPRSAIKDAHHAAYQCERQHVVIFTGHSFRVVSASKQHTVSGAVVYVANPECVSEVIA